VTVFISNASGVPGSGNLLEEVGWNSPLQRCNLSAFIVGSGVGDKIYRYNVVLHRYEEAEFFEGYGWYGEFFDCFDPGSGYIFMPVNASYNFTYSRDG
jgi:hypothetical protein